MKDALCALAYMHQRGVMHRDLKPENLLCSNKETNTSIKIADFGFAAHIQGEKVSDMCGTPDYISPEMAMKKPYGVQVDMWAIGVILYILLCGYAPFQAEKTSVMFGKIKKGTFVFHEQYWKDVSDLAKDFVRKMLVVDSSTRLCAADALKHPWMMESPITLSKYKMPELNQKTFKRFNAKRKIIAAARAIIAMNRMKNITFKQARAHIAVEGTVNPILAAASDGLTAPLI
jgi:calcium/calmodulin-dependent protein kinase I